MEVSTLHLPVALTHAFPIGKKLASPGNGIVKMGLNDFRNKKTTSSSSPGQLKTCSAVVSNRAPPAINKVADDDEVLEKVPPWDLVTEPGALVTTTPLGLSDDELKAKEYMVGILSSTVYDVAKQSALEHAASLYDKYGINVFLKREDRQSVFSFKLRGAYNMISKLPEEELKKGVICASAGNHAQGVALSASKLGGKSLIYMPTTTPEIKKNAVEKLGGVVVPYGNTYDEAQAEAKRVAEEKGLTYIPPFDHEDIIAGQGTIAVELGRQMTRPTYAIFVPIGGGGLISGIATFMKRVYPEIKIIGVEPREANSMALAFKYEKRVTVEPIGKFADGVAVATVGKETFKLSRELVDGVVLVSRPEISSAIQDMYEENRMISEPSGALAIAGAVAYCKANNLKDINVVAVISGANMDFKQFSVITEYADIGAETESVYVSFLVEEPGGLRKLVERIVPLDITECKYRYDPDQENALVYYRVGYEKKSELEEMEYRLESANIRTINLTDNELVNDHLKHLVGSRASIENEVLYRFLLPEKSGSLLSFLDAFSPRWNVTMLNYRGQGEVVAHLLAGFQVKEDEVAEFEAIADKLGFVYKRETNNNAFQLLMQ